MAAMMNGNTATQDGLSVPIAEKLQFFRNSDAERDQLVQVISASSDVHHNHVAHFLLLFNYVPTYC